MTNFEDHFSQHAGAYARYRPRYPSELFAYLASVAPCSRLAWDCATGNGQAARELVRHFHRVIATDASSEQMDRAFPHERIDYRIERAEEPSLESASVDLVAVGIAVHWFDLEPFYRAVRRVTVAKGILAVWTYHLPEIDFRVDRVVARYYGEVLAGYWPERIRYLDERYRTLPFPFEELDPPGFEIRADWDLEHLVGFLDSWSAARRFHAERGLHPVGLIRSELKEAWGEPGRSRTVRWPLHLRVGRVG